MNTPLLDHILYINLDSRTDRNEHAIIELKKLNPPNGFERFPAIVHPLHGAIGCTMSHIRCLEIAKERRYPYIFICEDDITFLDPSLLLEKMQNFWNDPPPKGWDVLLVCSNIFKYIDFTDYAIQVKASYAPTGYIVQQHYYDVLLENFKKGLGLFIQNPNEKYNYAIDVVWSELQSSLDSRWFMLNPPTATQYPSYSDIEYKDVNYFDEILNMSYSVKETM